MREVYKNIVRAFTLAEVLIVLTIIGVVAAMTIPTLMRNYNHKQIETKLKRTYSVLYNAFEMSKVENGDYGLWSWNEYPAGEQRTQYFFSHYLIPYLKVQKVCAPSSGDCFPSDNKNPLGVRALDVSRLSYVSFILNDGTSVIGWAGGDAYTPHVHIIVDINGFSKPNMYGQDIFRMIFRKSDFTDSVGTLDDDSVYTQSSVCKTNAGLSIYLACINYPASFYFQPNSTNVSETGTKYNMYCPTQGTTCGAAIKANGWKIPDNYPW